MPCRPVTSAACLGENGAYGRDRRRMAKASWVTRAAVISDSCHSPILPLRLPP